MLIYVPYLINFIILKNFNKITLLLIYNKKRFIITRICNIKTYKSISIITLNINFNYKNLLQAPHLPRYIYNWSNFYLKKITFKGKGYKIIKKMGFLMLNFNHAHLT